MKIPHQWLSPALFNLIWCKLRAAPTEDSVGQPEWPLKVSLKFTLNIFLKFQTKTNDQDTLDAFLANDEASTYCQDLPNMLKVKHAVDLFINVIIRN